MLATQRGHKNHSSLQAVLVIVAIATLIAAVAIIDQAVLRIDGGSDSQNSEANDASTAWEPRDISQNPGEPPGPDWEWRGNGPPGSSRGSWYNPKTLESLHPDPDHPPPEGPHTDYVNSKGERWRLFPDGRKERKK